MCIIKKAVVVMVRQTVVSKGIELLPCIGGFTAYSKNLKTGALRP